MPNTTTNYNLTKPLETERYDVQVFNNNADIIDVAMKTNADNISNVNTRLDNLNTWTTVEFTLADFTYDEKSGVTYLRTEAPSGYEIAEIKGYFVLNKISKGDTTYLIAIDIAPANDFRLLNHVLNTGVPTSILGYAAIFNGSINNELKYISSQNIYRSVASNINWSDGKAILSSSSITGRSINNTSSDSSGVNLKTNIPYTNISEFYGKLQYRVVPS